MKILIDGREYVLTPETQTALLMQLQAFEVDAYQRSDETLRFLLKPIVRHLLAKMEDKLRKEVGREEAARLCRPRKLENGRKEDPVLHFLALHMAWSQRMLGNAEFQITTDGNAIVACSIEAPNKVGGSLAIDGDQRERENNGAEVPGRGLFAALSDGAALRS